ncbi:hypothetical protein PHJA_002072100 [Phtheirospermum japonicum]|uniref:Uncharacterized protein n=1 Tax=Phtheirospermum japonicum TaxID=374723 RepID=A0A830CYR1_9LAMI|nr:hypothetical protein PHJA_002072100 [Phtheirospermum japonicum]
MAMANAASLSAFRTLSSSPSRLPFTSHSHSPLINSPKILSSNSRPIYTPTFALKNSEICEADDVIIVEKDDNEVILYSFSPLSLLPLAAALPGATTVTSLFSPFVELVKSLNLPDWLVHWGHPGNMAVVLFAMGGYGTYLGYRIRFSDDVEEKAKAKDLHPKLLGGIPHAVTGFIGLALLTIQTVLPALFEGNPGLRNVHGILGSGIMTLFLVHAALGLQLGLSY